MLSKNLKLIGSSESTIIEWKPSLSQMSQIIESVVAFANTEGGWLLVGISKTGEVVGVQIGKNTVEDLVNRIAQHTDPKIHPKITVKKIEGEQVIVIEVKPSKDKLVLADGRPYKRVGPATRQMGKDEYEGLIVDKHKDKFQFDEMICKEATLKDIDAKKVEWFLEEAKRQGRLNVPSNTPVKEALVRLKLLRGEKLTNAAILLFGKEPQYFFEQAKIRAARFKGMDSNDYIDMKVLEGTIPELREKALGFIAEHTRHAVFFDSNQRYDKWEYPSRALEEIFNNALGHRDYWSNADLFLSIYDDRIEVWNPGELPKELTLSKLKGKHLSFPRNKFLVGRLFYIKYIEEWGKGTNRIVAAMREDKLPDPIFELLTGGLNVTLIGPGKSFAKAMDEAKVHKLDLNDRQKKAMEYVKAKGSIKRSEYVKLGEVSPKTAHLELRKMVKDRIFIQTGSGPSTRYELSTR